MKTQGEFAMSPRPASRHSIAILMMQNMATQPGVKLCRSAVKAGMLVPAADFIIGLLS